MKDNKTKPIHARFNDDNYRILKKALKLVKKVDGYKSEQAVVSHILNEWIDANKDAPMILVDERFLKPNGGNTRFSYRYENDMQQEAFEACAEIADLELAKFSSTSSIFRSVLMSWAEHVLARDERSNQAQLNFSRKEAAA